MDPGYRERQVYYSRDQDQQQDIRHHQQQQQHQLQQQQPQLLPHYAHQLQHHQSLLQPHLPTQHQLHHSQAAFVLDQAEPVRGRDDFASRLAGSGVLPQMIPGGGQVLGSSMHRSHSHFTEHGHTHLTQLSTTSQPSFAPPSSSSQPSSAVDASDTGHAFIPSQSPSLNDSADDQENDRGDDGGEVVVENARVVTVSEPQITPISTTSSIIVDMDIPKKRAVRLALAETQQNLQTVNTRTLQSPPQRYSAIPAPDIWKPDLPIGLSLKFSLDGKKIVGVRSERTLEKGARFGPFNGKLVDEAIGSAKDSAWELCMRGKVFFYVEGQNKSHNNWMAFIESANSGDSQNLEAFQSYGDIYFRTTKVVEPGSELKVFYSDEYASHVGFKTKLSDANFKCESGSFLCSSCDQSYGSVKRLFRHMKLSHDPDRANDMKPVLTWEPRTTSSENTENEKPVVEKPPKPPKPQKLTSPTIKAVNANVKKTVSKIVIKKTSMLSTESMHVSEERFICTTCGKNFPTRGRLAAHETFHEFNEEHICTICGESCSNANNLAKHMVTHKDKPFKCQKCGKGFTTRNMVNRHERLSHQFNHTCRVCGMEFVKKRECNRHEKTHPDWKNFKVMLGAGKRGRKKKERAIKVDLSDEDGVDNGDLIFLNAEEGDIPIMDEEEEVEDNPNLPKDMLGKRINYYDRPRPYKCRFCSKRYLSRKAQLDHEAERHTKKCRFKCTHCPSVFATEIRYVEHVKRHVENRPFQCMLCPAAFASESALNNHQGEHTGLKPVKCDVCGKGFRTRHFMTAHKRRMHKVQQMRFTCSFCNKPFSDKGNLVKHERRHKGIRPYVCLVCGRGFTSNYCLTSHSYTHTKEKHFQCPHCEQKFTLNQHLTNHIYKEHTSNAGAKNRNSQGHSGDSVPAPQLVDITMEPQLQL